MVVDDRVRQRLRGGRALAVAPGTGLSSVAERRRVGSSVGRLTHPVEAIRARIASANGSGAWVGIQWLTPSSTTNS